MVAGVTVAHHLVTLQLTGLPYSAPQAEKPSCMWKSTIKVRWRLYLTAQPRYLRSMLFKGASHYQLETFQPLTSGYVDGDKKCAPQSVYKPG